MNAAPGPSTEFLPPEPPGLVRALLLALVAHGALLAMLMIGMNWKRNLPEVAAEAELWSAVPQEAAPRLQDVEPPPPPASVPPPSPPEPIKAPPPPPAVAPQPDLPDPKEAQIALEREKKKREQVERERELKLQKERQDKERLKKEAEKKEEAKRREAEERAAEKKAAEKKAAEKKEAERKAAEKEAEKLAEQKRKAEAEKAAKAKADAEKARKDKEEAQRAEAQRRENLQRIAGLAGASGGPNATGSAQQSSGPSASYAGRIRARIKPNIVFTDDVVGNPKAEVEVRLAPDGTIVGRRLLSSDGHSAWNDAVLRALDKTETLPRDIDGRVPTNLILTFRPKD